MMNKLFVLMVLSILCLSTGVLGLTASIGNAKMILNVELEGGQPSHVDRTILVKNVNNESVLIRLEPVGDIADMTTILDNDFELQPFTEKDARFRITVNKAGGYDGKIAVSFQPLGNGTQSGVGLQSQITLIAKGKGVPDSPVTGDDNTTVNSGNTIIEKNAGGLNPILGILIVIVVVSIGVVGYLLFSSKKQ